MGGKQGIMGSLSERPQKGEILLTFSDLLLSLEQSNSLYQGEYLCRLSALLLWLLQ